ncbi:MAG TPA: hypothetical protein VNN17_02750, partial [Terriglobia bacterium]|nr:hypothetical protein [Terriglobia bacterium]
KIAALIVWMFPVVVIALHGTAAAQDVEHRPWSELLIVVGKRVSVSLPDGAYLEGTALGVSHDALQMDAKKSTRPDRYPLGAVSIPRPMISLIQVWNRRSSKTPAAALIIGAATSARGLLGFGGFLGRIDGYGGLAATTAATLGGAILGAVISKKMDTEEVPTLIRILPDPPPLPSPAPGTPVAMAEPQRMASASGAGRGVSQEEAPLEYHTPTLSGKRLIRRRPKQNPPAEQWFVTPRRSRNQWAF